MAFQRRKVCVSILLVCLIAAPHLWGQSQNSSITGRATDPSGLPVVGVEIVAKSLATGDEYRAKSGEDGNYSLQALAVGMYSLRASLTGFSTFEKPSVQVQVATVVKIDIPMTMGQVTETVTVEGGAPVLETTSNSVATVIDDKQVAELPLKMSGSSTHIEQFVFLTPGAITARGEQGAPFNTQINGTQAFSRELTIDGISLATRNDEGQVYVPPNSESVGEFKVISTNAPAEYGYANGGVEVYSMKSGGREYHGSLYEFFRNEALDARGFFAAKVPVTRMNQFGGTLGGPVGIPYWKKLRDTFFFFSLQGFRFNTAPNSIITTVPTVAEKQGDFRDYPFPIYDPATTAPDGNGGFTRQQVSCNGVLNVICPDRISSVALGVASFFPDPNRPGEGGGVKNNFLGGTLANRSDENTWSIKGDTHLSDRQTLSATFNRGKLAAKNFGAFPPPVEGGVSRQQTLFGVFTHTFVLNKNLVNQLMYGYTYVNNGGVAPPDSRNFLDLLGFQGVPGNPPQFPAVSFSGPVSPEGFGVFAPFAIPEQSYQFRDDITYIRGKHTLKMGFDHRRILGGRQDTPRVNLGFSFLETSLPNSPDRTQTGSPFASLMLGAVDSASISYAPVRPGFRFRYYAGYIQDSYKVTPKLTVNAGLRWEASLPPFEAHDRMSSFEPDVPNPGAGGIPGALVFAGVGQGRIGKHRLADEHYKNFGPRIGFAYNLVPKTVIRAGFGVSYEQTTALGSARFPSTLGFNLGSFETGAQATSLDGGVTPAFHLDDGYPQNFSLPPSIDPSFANNQNVTWTPRDGYRPPYMLAWNLGVQRELSANTTVDVAYVGNKGTRLFSFLDIPNQLDPRYYSLGSLLTQDINSPEAQAAGIPSPYPGFTGSVAQALRPFPQYRTITKQIEPDGNSTYNALQVKVENRFSKNLSFLVSYTFSRTITDSDSALTFVAPNSHQNGYNKRAEKTIAMQDATHNLVMSYVYQLPIGKGQRFLNRGGVINGLLGNWGISGIHSYTSGFPQGFVVSSSMVNTVFSGAIRPDRVPGQSCRAKSGPGGFDVNRDPYFNPSAFAEPAPFTFGNAASRMSDCRLPAYFSEDISLLKKIRVDEKRSLEFQAELFNIFNRTIFDVPDLDVASPTFGRLTGQANTPRQIQFVLKFRY
jgi:Carboxypeptidase regulatory-like domain/TonB dependent receptor